MLKFTSKKVLKTFSPNWHSFIIEELTHWRSFVRFGSKSTKWGHTKWSKSCKTGKWRSTTGSFWWRCCCGGPKHWLAEGEDRSPSHLTNTCGHWYRGTWHLGLGSKSSKSIWNRTALSCLNTTGTRGVSTHKQHRASAGWARHCRRGEGELPGGVDISLCGCLTREDLVWGFGGRH